MVKPIDTIQVLITNIVQNRTQPKGKMAQSDTFQFDSYLKTGMCDILEVDHEDEKKKQSRAILAWNCLVLRQYQQNIIRGHDNATEY